MAAHECTVKHLFMCCSGKCASTTKSPRKHTLPGRQTAAHGIVQTGGPTLRSDMSACTTKERHLGSSCTQPEECITRLGQRPNADMATPLAAHVAPNLRPEVEEMHFVIGASKIPELPLLQFQKPLYTGTINPAPFLMVLTSAPSITALQRIL